MKSQKEIPVPRWIIFVWNMMLFFFKVLNLSAARSTLEGC